MQILMEILEWDFNLIFGAGGKKLANKAALWYVPCSLQNVNKIMEVPSIQVNNTIKYN